MVNHFVVTRKCYHFSVKYQARRILHILHRPMPPMCSFSILRKLFESQTRNGNGIKWWKGKLIHQLPLWSLHNRVHTQCWMTNNANPLQPTTYLVLYTKRTCVGSSQYEIIASLVILPLLSHHWWPCCWGLCHNIHTTMWLTHKYKLLCL